MKHNETQSGFPTGNTPNQQEDDLYDHVFEAIEKNERVLESRHFDDPWITRLWVFTRECKGHPALTELSADEALDAVDHVLRQITDAEDPWAELFLDSYDAELEFIDNWNKIRNIPGYSALDQAIDKARFWKLTPTRCERGGLKIYKDFISIAGWLQVTVGKQNIMLPCELLGSRLYPDVELGAAKMRISRLRSLAVRDEYLRVMADHEFGHGKTGRAAEFRFAVERFECLVELLPDAHD